MLFSQRFRQGMKAAIPIWIAFVPSSIAWGIAAQSHRLTLEEVILMSAWVYSGPAQFAVLVHRCGREVFFPGACCRDLDESAVFAHEHCAGALL